MPWCCSGEGAESHTLFTTNTGKLRETPEDPSTAGSFNSFFRSHVEKPHLYCALLGEWKPPCTSTDLPRDRKGRWAFPPICIRPRPVLGDDLSQERATSTERETVHWQQNGSARHHAHHFSCAWWPGPRPRNNLLFNNKIPGPCHSQISKQKAALIIAVWLQYRLGLPEDNQREFFPTQFILKRF